MYILCILYYIDIDIYILNYIVYGKCEERERCRYGDRRSARIGSATFLPEVLSLEPDETHGVLRHSTVLPCGMSTYKICASFDSKCELDLVSTCSCRQHYRQVFGFFFLIHIRCVFFNCNFGKFSNVSFLASFTSVVVGKVYVHQSSWAKLCVRYAWKTRSLGEI